MKLSKLKKVLAGFLALVMVAGYTSTVSAATSTNAKLSSSSSSNFDDALEQLNDATWSEYYWLVEGENRDVPTVKVDLATGKYENTNNFDTAYPYGTVAEIQAQLDALKAVAIPTVEVHLSDINEREEFRKFSYISLYAEKQIAGKGLEGYIEAIEYLKKVL